MVTLAIPTISILQSIDLEIFKEERRLGSNENLHFSQTENLVRFGKTCMLQDYATLRFQPPRFRREDTSGPLRSLKLALLEMAKISTVRHFVISSRTEKTSLGGCLVRPICLREMRFRDGILCLKITVSRLPYMGGGLVRDSILINISIIPFGKR